MNTCIAVGHVTADAVTRKVDIKGTPVLVTDFTVAANEGYGENQKTEYIRCTLWRDRGANLAKYLTKGKLVTIKGAISCQAWIGTKGENAGKAMCQLVMTNPAVELEGKKAEEPEQAPFNLAEEE